MLVIGVGANSFHGRILLAMQVVPEATPLQAKLSRLAETIAKAGFVAALSMFLALLIKYLVVHATSRQPWPPADLLVSQLTTILIQAITVVVVAVPEGLPMAVTLALAFATTRMLQDNNLVRVLSACETMGNATSICSDKTGTLTENRMTVVKGLFLASESYDRDEADSLDRLQKRVSSIAMGLVCESMALNSSAYPSIDPVTKRAAMVGSKTEAALLGLLSRLHYDFLEARSQTHTVELYPFASERKSMSTVVRARKPNGQPCYRQHTKGASEMVLGMCQWAMQTDGTVVEVSPAEAQRLLGIIGDYAQSGLRTLAVAFRDFGEAEWQAVGGPAAPVFQGLTLLAIVGLEDPIREGVPRAVAACQQAGIVVRMVTGDNAMTARTIAARCGILGPGQEEGVIEGPHFRALSDDELTGVVPRLRVLARSSPLDKQILVRKLRALGEVVAVTGDGTNDGPAMRAAHVSFAMGITGTEVAKEASSIILMDDNFASIVRAVLWGRCVNDAVRKFLQFQLTVNVTAVVVAFVSALLSREDHSVLSAVQLLWVNLIMDSLAALALATDKPAPDLLERPPEPPGCSLITPAMWRMILGQAVFQIALILLMTILGPRVLGLSLAKAEDRTVLATFVFNTFVFLQLFNEINCRQLGRKLNVFRGILTNWLFGAIWLGTVLGQVLIVTFGGSAFSTVPLGWHLWGVSVALGLLVLPLGALIRLLPFRDAAGPAPAAEPPQVAMTPERERWQTAAEDVRRGLRVFAALRRHHQMLLETQSQLSHQTA